VALHDRDKAASLGAIEVSPTDESFAMALDAVLSFKDRNRPQGTVHLTS
jgi:hypothetical protein